MKKALIFAVLCLLLMPAGLTGCGQRPQEAETENRRLYTTVVEYSGEDESTEKYLEIAGRSQKLLPLLEEHLGAFVMNAYNFQDVDGDGTPLYTLNGMDYPEEIDPNGRTVEISPGYLKANPIEAANGQPIEDQLVLDSLTLNLLVPEKFRDQESDIIKAHRARFYFQKVTAENTYNRDAGFKDRLDLSENDLAVNIIYVKDGQSYFTFREDCAADTDHRIIDPIAQVYTGNTHCNYAHSNLSQWTYFYWDGSAAQAFEAMKPYVEQCGAEESFQKVTPAELLPED